MSSGLRVSLGVATGPNGRADFGAQTCRGAAIIPPGKFASRGLPVASGRLHAAEKRLVKRADQLSPALFAMIAGDGDLADWRLAEDPLFTRACRRLRQEWNFPVGTNFSVARQPLYLA
jgi:hypothetical protein